jgi:hypothetical protein
MWYIIHKPTNTVIKPGHDSMTLAECHLSELVSQLRPVKPEISTSEFDVDLLTENAINEIEQKKS